MLCCGYTLTDFPISIRLTSLALWQSNDCPSASKATLMNMEKYFMWIHYERLHDHNKAKHNKTVCIFLGIYCTSRHMSQCYMYGRICLNQSEKPYICNIFSHWLRPYSAVCIQKRVLIMWWTSSQSRYFITLNQWDKEKIDKTPTGIHNWNRSLELDNMYCLGKANGWWPMHIIPKAFNFKTPGHLKIEKVQQ